MESRNVTAEPPTRAPQFTIRLSSTRRGARLARRLAAQQLADWGIAYDAEASRATAVITAELATNAITHGRLAGRDFCLVLRLLPGVVRVEVTDARPERLPPTTAPSEPTPPEVESGRGLLLVAAHAERWGCETGDPYTKTVWAEVAHSSSSWR
ncbi:ATP-binding protein [Streptomyces sp. NPDC000880]